MEERKNELKQKLSLYDPSLVRIVTQVIVEEDKVQSVLKSKDIEGIVSRKGYDEKDISKILGLFFDLGIIEIPYKIKGERLTQMNNFEFVLNKEKLTLI